MSFFLGIFKVAVYKVSLTPCSELMERFADAAEMKMIV